MLWVDDDFITAADLYSMDSELQSVTGTESITLEGSTGVIRRAKEAAQGTLQRFMSLKNFAPSDLAFRNVNLPLVVQDLRWNYAGLAQLVVSGESEDSWSVLKKWVVSKTLCEVYRMATNKNADRYSDRYEGMEAQRRDEYWPNFKRRGLPIVFNPLVAPGAIMERVGRFTASNLSLVANIAGTATTAFDFAITWVGPLYVDHGAKNNEESYRSARVSLTLTTGNLAQVSIAGLTPPDGNQPDFTKSYCRYTPGQAVGWNVWAGDPSDANKTMYRQNASVIPIGTTSFTLTGNPTLSGEQLDLGQFESMILEIKNELQRGD